MQTLRPAPPARNPSLSLPRLPACVSARWCFWTAVAMFWERRSLSGTGLGGLGVLVPGNVLLVAGDGIYKGSVLDGSPATAASLYLPTSVTMDGAGRSEEHTS